MSEILIITGGSVDYDWAEKWISTRHFDYIIAADSGLVHADLLGIRVNYILGDYDSVDEKVLEKYMDNTEIVTYPKEKDYTDTDIAIKKALEMMPEKISIIGATGSRYDHAMNNIFNMKQLLNNGIDCAIYDRNNKIYLKDNRFKILKCDQYGEYISFVPMTEKVKISITGTKYNASDLCLCQGMSICQSNEIVDDFAEITIQNGVIIVFETKD